LSQQR